jgi:hypothetical protein
MTSGLVWSYLRLGARLIRAVGRDLIGYSHLSAEFYRLVTAPAEAVATIARIVVQPHEGMRRRRV